MPHNWTTGVRSKRWQMHSRHGEMSGLHLSPRGRRSFGELIHIDIKKLGRIDGIGHRITGGLEPAQSTLVPRNGFGGLAVNRLALLPKSLAGRDPSENNLWQVP